MRVLRLRASTLAAPRAANNSPACGAPREEAADALGDGALARPRDGK